MSVFSMHPCAFSCQPSFLIFGALNWYFWCPSKSGLMNKHIVKHTLYVWTYRDCYRYWDWFMNIFKRMSRTLAEAGPTLRVTLFMGEAAQASH
jgi:hypothetical protein